MNQDTRTSKGAKAAVTASPSSEGLAKLVAQFYEAHPDSLHDERVVAAVIGCSQEKLQRDRWSGKGLPFHRFGRLVRYRKRDVTDRPAINPAAREAARAAA